MTYEERITYLTGNFIQLSQFTLKNACRAISLLRIEDNSYPLIMKAEKEAEEMLLSFEFIGSEKIIESLKDSLLSKKMLEELSFILKKRDYVVSYFYVENASAIAREEIAIYESKINELDGYCKRAVKLNQDLALLCDKIYR